MATPDAPRAAIDWASAQVRDGELSLPFRGRLSGACLAHLRDRVGRHLPEDVAPTITVSATRITVAPVRRGAAADVYQLLERVVDESNAAFAIQEGTQRQRRARWGSVVGSVALMVLAAAAVALQRLDLEPARAAIVLAFVAIAPGWAILRLCDLARGWSGVALAVALSLALTILIALATAYAGGWSPERALVALASITVLAAVAATWRDRRQAPKTASLPARA